MTSEILNYIFGGGFVALCIGVITLRAKVRKANAEAAQARAQAEKAEAEAEAVRITNTENATRILVENIVKPLKEELNATREELRSSQRTMSRLAEAVEAISECRHADDCPVRYRLRDYPKSELGRGAGNSPDIGVRQYVGGHPLAYGGVRAREPGADDDTG